MPQASVLISRDCSAPSGRITLAGLHSSISYAILCITDYCTSTIIHATSPSMSNKSKVCLIWYCWFRSHHREQQVATITACLYNTDSSKRVSTVLQFVKMMAAARHVGFVISEYAVVMSESVRYHVPRSELQPSALFCSTLQYSTATAQALSWPSSRRELRRSGRGSCPPWWAQPIAGSGL